MIRPLRSFVAVVAAALLVVGGLATAPPAAYAEDAVAEEQLVQTPLDDGEAGDTLPPASEAEPLDDDQTDELADTSTQSDALLAEEPEPRDSEEEGAVETQVRATPSSTSVQSGEEVRFFVEVTPRDALGSVELVRENDEVIVSGVQLVEGSAVLASSSLGVGVNRVFIRFTPEDADHYVPSESEQYTIQVVGDVPVEGATLDWGVRESFRNYITGSIAHGGIDRIGAAISGQTTRPFPGDFGWIWDGGDGIVRSDGSTADVKFSTGSGLHFFGHSIGGIYALDIQITNPRVVVDSATSGKLYMDVKSRKFAGMGEISDAVFEQSNVHIADLSLSTPRHDEAVSAFTWENAGARLTSLGSDAFGGFYGEGEALDPVTFTLPYDLDGEIVIPGKIETHTNLTASTTELEEGKSVELSARVDPAVNGTVEFFSSDRRISETVTVSGGTAKLTLHNLKAAIYELQALFTPEDSAEYGHSYSNSIEIVVSPREQSGPGESTAPPSSSKRAGSLTWGISSYFAAYTTAKSRTPECPTPSRHCASGTISTSGVGSGWTFPQSSTDWNDSTQTGTVTFSGSVVFAGYGMTMFQVASPTITVHNSSSATLNTGYSGTHGPSSVQLNLGAASKSVGANGEVTWSGVPVQGSMAGISAGQGIGFDNLTFTVGTASGVSYGSTTQAAPEAPERTPAATPPATTGITVLTDPEKIRAGGRIEIEAYGFDANDEGVLVVLYSEPILLDDSAKADARGRVTWSGTLPDDVTGEHTLTLQGSTDAGAVIDILDPDEKKKAATKRPEIEQGVQAEAIQAAGPLTSSGGMQLWEWWASAGALVLIAACTTALAIRQRRLNS